MKRSLRLAAAVALASALMTAPAYAYLDAGSVSMALQVTIGAVASVVVVAKVYLARVTGFFRRALSSSADQSIKGDAETR